MKIIVISDTHTNTNSLQRVIDANPECEIILHAGDGCGDLRRIDRKNKGFISVKGNCDRYEDFDEEEQIIALDGIKIFLTHGHRYNVKSTKELLLAKSMKENARVCIFGHTHILHKNIMNGVLFLNPGSLGYDGSYIILDTENPSDAQIFNINL